MFGWLFKGEVEEEEGGRGGREMFLGKKYFAYTVFSSGVPGAPLPSRSRFLYQQKLLENTNRS